MPRAYSIKEYDALDAKLHQHTAQCPLCIMFALATLAPTPMGPRVQRVRTPRHELPSPTWYGAIVHVQGVLTLLPIAYGVLPNRGTGERTSPCRRYYVARGGYLTS